MATADDTMAATESESATSTRNGEAEPPPDRISLATASAPSAARSATTTAAPSAANNDAEARPIPLAAPVTTATLPSSRPTCLLGSSFPGVVPGSMGARRRALLAEPYRRRESRRGEVDRAVGY